MDIITTSGHQITLEIESELTKQQKSCIEKAFNYASTVLFGNDIRGVLCKELQYQPHFDKVGYGGYHIWISDDKGNRLAIIKIKDINIKKP